jgi:phosphatidyl-myo-inositol dimannoside synthase
MKNVLLNLESLSSSDGGISRVANLLLKFFIERGGYNLTVNIFRDSSYSYPKKKNVTIITNSKSKLRFFINNLIQTFYADYIIYDHLGLARSNFFYPLKKPFVTIGHGIDVWNKKRKDRISIHKKSNLPLFVSNFSKNKTESIHGKVKKAKVCWLSTIYNQSKKLNINKKNINFLLLSRLEEGKGHLRLLDSWFKFSKINKKVNLMIVGRGPEQENIKKHIEQLGLNGSVRLYGYLSKRKLEKIWKKTHVFVMPSRVEGFGLVYIEAMSRGIPLITSKQDAGCEINIHNKTGLVADLDNCKVDELYLCLKKITQNNKKSKSFSSAAYKRWSEHFSFKQFQKRFKKIIIEFENKIN